MKLDRNTTEDGKCKYALIHLRKFRKMLLNDPDNYATATAAIESLERLGLVHYGTEGPGEQIFVMKYKDMFTAPALSAYCGAIAKKLKDPELAPGPRQSLGEYHSEMLTEFGRAHQQGEKIPD